MPDILTKKIIAVYYDLIHQLQRERNNFLAHRFYNTGGTMKFKKNESKLSLNKQTISNLGTLELNIVKGGTEDLTSMCTADHLCKSIQVCQPFSPICPTTKE